MKRRKYVEEPTMSDKTLLLNVEDLINTAFGTADRNVVNFKMIQAVLHILARQMRLLEQDVEIRVDEFGLDGKPLEAYASEAGFVETKKGKRGGRKEGRRQGKDADRIEEGGAIGRSYDEDEDYDDRDYDRGRDRDGGKARGRRKDDDRDEERGGGRGRDRDYDRDEERGGSRGRDRDYDRDGDRGSSRGRDRDSDRDGERGGGRGRDRDSDRDGDRGSSRGRDRDDDRGGGKGGRRGRDRDDDRDGERGGSRGRDRDDDRGGERGGGRGGTRGDDRSGERRGERGGETEGGARGKGGKGGGGAGGGGGGGRDEYEEGERGGDRSRDRGGGRGADREGRGGEKGSSRGSGREDDRSGEEGGGRRERGGDREDSRRQRGQRDDDQDRSGGRGGAREGERGGRDGDRGGRDGDRGGRDGERGGRDGERGGREKRGRGGGGRGATGEDFDGGSASGDSADGDERSRRKRDETGKILSARSAERMRAQKSGTPSSGRSTSGAKTPGSRSSITVSESMRKGQKGGQDKVLVVGKGQTSGGRAPRVGSIDVVTASQFALLERSVRELQKIAGPLPTPSMPDNQRLRQDLAKGTASLTDTMKAMQLQARVKAAERGLTQMAGLLTQLAATGALPSEMASRIGEVGNEFKRFSKSSDEVGGRQQAYGQGPGQGAFVGPLPGQVAGQYADQMPGPGQGMPVQAYPPGARKGPPGSRGAPSTTATSGGQDRYGQEPGAQGFAPHSSRAASTATGYLPWEPGAGAPESLGSASFRKSVAIDPVTGVARTRGSMIGGHKSSDAGVYKAVTHAEMDNVVAIVRDDLKKAINTMTARATHSADVAVATSKGVAEKMDLAMRLDKRITKLSSQAADYAAQLSGFDSGLATQMASFQEQMAMVRNELKEGLERLEQATNNAESAALMDLTERYQGLVLELEHTLHTHQGLTTLQTQLNDELRSLVECVEMLREQKADRDEVFDGLRDKADISRLNGLLHETDFMHARAELDNRLMHCYEKFTKQDIVWLAALRDLALMAESKAEIIQLMVVKDTATAELKAIQAKLRHLYIMLGEPKAAVLMRMLAKDAACAACLTPALMVPTEPKYGMPFALAQFRPPPVGQEDPCLTKLRPLVPEDTRSHVCRRWAGGSHTLVSEHVSRERAAPPAPHGPPTKRYTGYGSDGRLYMLEEELLPCLECNQVEAAEPAAPAQVIAIEPKPSPNVGAGDQVVAEAEQEKEIEAEKEKEPERQNEKEGEGDNASLKSEPLE